MNKTFFIDSDFFSRNIAFETLTNLQGCDFSQT